MTEEFKQYQEQVVKNAKALAEGLKKRGFVLISGGTDNHLMLVNVKERGYTGRQAADLLDAVGITVNFNVIPFDTESPFVTSGIRLGTPAVTTRGLKEADMEEIAAIIGDTLIPSATDYTENRKRVQAITDRFPIYPELHVRS